MTTLAADKPRDYAIGDIEEYDVIASDIIYEGAAVGLSSGNARPLQAGDPFVGFAIERVDNASGSAGDKTVRVRRDKVVLPVTGVSGKADVGKDVYASDDDTFTLTQGANTRVGYVERFISGTDVVVALEPVRGAEAELTDNSGGSADNTIAAVSGSGADPAINANFADLAAKVNYLLRKMGG